MKSSLSSANEPVIQNSQNGMDLLSELMSSATDEKAMNEELREELDRWIRNHPH